MESDPRYADINNVNYPPCSRDEARRAVARILRAVGRKSSEYPAQLRDARCSFSTPRRCWVSLKPTTGVHKGWGRLIHDVGHVIFKARRPNSRPHDHGHEQVEREVLLLCQTSGFLDGALKKPEVKPTRREKLLAEYLSLDKRYDSWITKWKRANTAIEKISKRRKAIDRELQKLPRDPA